MFPHSQGPFHIGALDGAHGEDRKQGFMRTKKKSVGGGDPRPPIPKFGGRGGGKTPCAQILGGRQFISRGGFWGSVGGSLPRFEGGG